jgi:Fe-S-cluster containining protein
MTKTRRVHLRVLGAEHDFDLPELEAKGRVVALFGPARALTEAVVGTALDHAASRGERSTCGPACGACCRQLVPVSPIEAVLLFELVVAMPKPRRDVLRATFARAVAKLESCGLVDKSRRGRAELLADPAPGQSAWDDASRRYFEAQIACPFLENESCSIYADRPLVCREYHVVTPPNRCEKLDGGARTIPRPIWMGEALTAAGNAILGGEAQSIPLVLALEWVSVHGEALRRAQHDGAAMMKALLDSIVVEEE